ncbi:hypothetical protein NAEGRDRAFT_78707 [Naegleria gruberi]|uniref:Peptidase A1 domain-containing protein n=1 Tax=Naegleria gruberi TaxID=5762 RepID=D2V5W6_NAEGR|nr:uncharacterized protein NAEGRDRAFT_78707 [Naegleria gruberi]EFC47869.1 hypothetical protein NAEGRDRAFT_78707 [Naegleria gruberi]|eukprot:XP_002680613.1 hypothetical protein NAEGRDRAFT_78707 [Naegleria gruberi strain NEG-M]
MQSSYFSLKPNISSISMESTRTREPISNTITLSSDNNSSSQNRNNTSQTNSIHDLSNNTNNYNTPTTGISTTQQILIDEGTIDCLSLPSKAPSLLSSCPKSFKNLNVYNDNKSLQKMDEDQDDEEDEVDQLRIDEGTEAITPTIITNKNSLMSNNETKMLSNHNSNHSSSILDTLINSTNGPSCSMSSTITTSAITNGPAAIAATSSPSSILMMNNNNFAHNFPFLSSTIANSPSKGGFLDRLFTFSPNAASSGVMSHLVTPLKTPNTSYQDRVSLFTSSPQKIELLSSPNDSTHSNAFSSNLTNSLLSNDESPNFSNLWLNQQQQQLKQTSNNGASNLLGNNSNNTANVILTTFQCIQKHTINQKELRRAQEKTKNNLKHFLNDSTLINTNGKIVSPLTAAATHQTNATLTTPTNSTISPTTTNSSKQMMATIIPIGKRRVDITPRNYTIADDKPIHYLDQYFVNATLNDDEEPLTLFIDSHEPLLIQFCCSSKSKSNGCFESLTCSAVECEKCPETKRHFTYYKSINETIMKKSFEVKKVTVDRNKPNIPVKKLSIGSLERTYPTVATQPYYTIEIAYADSDIWQGLDGIIGLGYGIFNVTFKSLVEKDDPTYKQMALHLKFDNETYSENGGAIYIGKKTIEDELLKSDLVDPNHRKIYWGERQYRINENAWKYAKESESNTYIYTYDHRLPVYHLSMECSSSFLSSNRSMNGIDLISGYSSSWKITFSTRIDGIALPGPFYEAVMSWLLKYNLVSGINGVLTEEQINSLPALSFVLGDGDDKNYEKFVIPLSILYGPNGLSLYKRDEGFYVYDGDLVTFDPSIEIGTLVWSKLFIPVLDMSKYKVGLIKRAGVEYNNFNPDFCKGLSIASTCKGAQSYYVPTNQCIDPSCSSYFFQYVNPNTKTCDLSIGFYFAIFVIVAACVVAEFVVFEFHLRMGKKLQQASRSNPSRLPIPPRQ